MPPPSSTSDLLRDRRSGELSGVGAVWSEARGQFAGAIEPGLTGEILLRFNRGVLEKAKFTLEARVEAHRLQSKGSDSEPDRPE